MRRKRAIIKLVHRLVCMVLLTVVAGQMLAQQDNKVKSFKVKDNIMYIALSRDLSDGAIDSFVLKYNLGDIGLKRFFRLGTDDSLRLMGWDIDRSKKELFVITKPLEQVADLFEELCNTVFSPVPTPEDWRVVGGNRVIYGQNSFKDGKSFQRENGIVHFKLKGYNNAKRVRLAGNFTNWQHAAFPMTKTSEGWEAAVELKPGKYYYKFIINNNEWLKDPNNNVSENDGRGNENSVFFVTNKTLELKGYPEARKVFATGSFDNWSKSKILLQKTKSGWATDIYLEPGTHSYSFIVDGVEVKDKQSDQKPWVSIGDAHTFTLKGFQDARKVTVAGNFNDWNKDALQMQRTDDGWQLSYSLGRGNYQYKFIIDGRWIVDPENPAVIEDGKGNKNSFLIIGPNYQFRLKDHGSARSVFLAGDFNEWSPIGLPMKKEGDVWVCSIYLAPGKHLYKFIVDGKWIRDPKNKNWEQNREGSGNSVIWVEEEV